MCADRIGERDATSSALVRLGKRAALCWTGVVRHPSDPQVRRPGVPPLPNKSVDGIRRVPRSI
jgi:hypothetical protein